MTQPVSPLAGRFGIIGYDKTLVLQGDLATISGQGGSAANNGIPFLYPSRNVRLDIDIGRWHAELGIWQESLQAYAWVMMNLPINSVLYYPEVPGTEDDLHAWLTGTHVFADLEEAGALTVYSYDGNASIPGDLTPGADNGILFTLPFKNGHIIVGSGGQVWHGKLFIRDIDGVSKYAHVVYPGALCGRQTLTLAALQTITGQP